MGKMMLTSGPNKHFVLILNKIELGGKATEGKDPASSKKNKGTSGNHSLVGVKAGDGGEATFGSGDDVGTQSAESGNEGSSDASDDNNEDFPKAKKGSFNQMLADGAITKNNTVQSNLQSSVAGNPVASVPGNNLNIGMNFWNASPVTGSGTMVLLPNQPDVSQNVAPSGVMNDQLIHIQFQERLVKLTDMYG